MKIDFLTTEYHECFSQMRYYESLQVKILNLSILLLSLFISIVWFSENLSSWDTHTLIVLGSFLLATFNVVSLSIVLKVRIYFVICARQVNTIRKFLLESEAPEFLPLNKMYVSENFPIFKGASYHSFIAYALVLFIAVYISIGTSFILNPLNPWWLEICVFLLVIVCGVIWVCIYWKHKDGKSADKTIHKQS